MSLSAFEVQLVFPEQPFERPANPLIVYAPPTPRIEATVQARGVGEAAVSYAVSYDAQRSGDAEAVKAKVKDACKQLPEWQNVLTLRRKLTNIQSTRSQLQARLADAKRRHDEALLRDDARVDPIEQEIEAAQKELDRLDRLERLVFGNPREGQDHPVIEAAQSAYEAKAKELWEAARVEWEKEVEARQQAIKAELEPLLERKAAELAVERNHMGFAKQHFHPSQTPAVQ